MLKEILIVGFGGFVGSVMRYLISLALKTVGSGFPFGTLVANVLGCFFIGFFYGLASRHLFVSPNLLLLLTTGFCGGFTTFSTFSKESLCMIQHGDYMMFALYVLGSLLLGLLAVWGGVVVAKNFNV